MESIRQSLAGAPLPRSTAEYSGDVQALTDRLATCCAKPVVGDIQKRIGELVNLMPLLNSVGDQIVLLQAKACAEALCSDEPNIELADVIYKRLKERLRSRNSPFGMAFFNGAPSVRVIVGMLSTLYFLIPIGMLIVVGLTPYTHLLGIPIKTLGMLTFFGGLGSVVSVMVRLHDIDRMQAPIGSTLFFTGLFKPIIGSSFAVFAYCVVGSGVVPIVVNPDKANLFFAALSFLAGFSERIAQDLVSKAEVSVGQSSKE